MQAVKPAELLERVRTPHKLGQLVLAASYRPDDFDSRGIDVPSCSATAAATG